MAQGTCSIEGCGKVGRLENGMCSKHAARVRRHGDPHFVKRFFGDIERRWLQKVDVRGGPVAKNNPELGRCSLWTGFRAKDGYGRFSIAAGVSVLAHRWGYEHFIGPIPDGFHLDHFACDNGGGACVELSHVRPVTPAENAYRGDSPTAWNLAKTHCPQGHPYDEANTYTHPVTGWRRCRACGHAASARAAAQAKESRRLKRQERIDHGG